MALLSFLLIVYLAAATVRGASSTLFLHSRQHTDLGAVEFSATKARSSFTCLYNVTAAEESDLPKFAGIWYIDAVTTPVDNKQWTCAKLNFSHLIHYPNLDHFNVTYHAVYHGKSYDFAGYLVHNNKTLDGDMVGFYDAHDDRVAVDFRIVLTDYDNYAMVYLCDPNNPVSASEQILLLSRRRTGLKVYRYHALKKELKRWGWNHNSLDRLKNGGCT